jgi:soluble lytic murein transglycosylase-like protein
LGKRILLGTAAVAFVSACIIVPVRCAANNDEQEPVVQVTVAPTVEPTATPAVESKAPEVIVDVPAEPIPEAAVVSVYDVPLDLEVQLFIIQACEDHHIEPSIVIAMIERESRFKVDAMGDKGAAYGLTQIQPRWHQARIDRLGVTDLLDPCQNVLVCIDFLAELLDHYNGDIECALMAYNAGMSGANKYWFSKGIYSNDYSRGIMERSRFFKEGMIDYVLD